MPSDEEVAPGVSNETLARQGGPFALLACCHVEAFKGDDDKVGAIGAMQRPERQQHTITITVNNTPYRPAEPFVPFVNEKGQPDEYCSSVRVSRSIHPPCLRRRGKKMSLRT